MAAPLDVPTSGDVAPESVLEGVSGQAIEGRSLGQIAEDLNDQGHKTRRERRWSKTQVKRVLDRVRPA